MTNTERIDAHTHLRRMKNAHFWSNTPESVKKEIRYKLTFIAQAMDAAVAYKQRFARGTITVVYPRQKSERKRLEEAMVS